MTTLDERPNTALLIVDVQVDVVSGAWDRDGVIARINTLVEDAHTTEDLRQWGVPVSPEQVIAHTNTYWSWSDAPGRKGDVQPAADIDFAAS